MNQLAKISRNEKGFRVGQGHHRAKHSDADVALIVELHDVYRMGYKQLSKKFNIPVRTIRKYCNGQMRSGITTQ